MKNNQQFKYPSWYWVCRNSNRILFQISGGLLFILVLYLLITAQSIISYIVLILLFLFLLWLGNDKRYTRGNVPKFLLMRMARTFESSRMNTYEIQRTIKRAYERSARISQLKPKDAWLSKENLKRAFEEESKALVDHEDKLEYKELCKHIEQRYYSS